jgi:hypothetical protein
VTHEAPHDNGRGESCGTLSYVAGSGFRACHAIISPASHTSPPLLWHRLHRADLKLGCVTALCLTTVF